MKFQGVRIAGTGAFAPDNVVTNDDLSKKMDTSDEWIRTRTGIRERRIAADDVFTSDLSTGAAKEALENAGVEAQDLDLIIVATLSPDKPFANTASIVQAKLGNTTAMAFSVEAGCTGFVYIYQIAAGMIASGLHKKALIIGAEKLSAVTNWDDRTTCVLFGDGAGAAVLEACAPEESTYIASKMGSDGNYSDILHIPGGGVAQPLSKENFDEGTQFLQMNGQEVFKLAVTNMAQAAKDALAEAGMTIDDVDHLIPHQANVRIISAVGKRLGIADDKVVINVDRYGNTSAATIPIAFHEQIAAGKIKRGDKVLFVAFGGGLTWGANIIQY